jgi:hypothetical protein
MPTVRHRGSDSVSASTTIRVAAARCLSSYSSHASPSSGGVVY